MWSWKRSRSVRERAPSTYSVTSSVISLQLNMALCSAEVPLQRLTHLRARAVEEHPLIRHRDTEKITCLLGTHTLEVPQRDDGALALGQRGHDVLHHLHRLLAPEQLLGRLRRPGVGRVLPHPFRVEARGVDPGFATLTPIPLRKRRKRHRPRLACAACLRPVGEDTEDPRLE